MELYEEEKRRATEKGLIVPPDGMPDPSNVDGDLNYHLELVDLLGMCAKGHTPKPNPTPNPTPNPAPNPTPNPNPNLTRCAKGRNPVTEEYCRRWFSEDDLFRVLSQVELYVCAAYT